MINIIIPAAGLGSRFSSVGWKKPKPFIRINEESMILKVIENITPNVEFNLTLILREEHIEKEFISISDFKSKGYKIVGLNYLTEGTLSTVLHARKYIQNNNPVLIANSDQIVDFDINKFIQDCFDRDLDGSILVFRDKDRNPKWSFAKVDSRGLVEQVAEKEPISDLATVGIYLFNSGNDFINAAIDMISSNQRVNNEFYTCPVYNTLINEGARIGVYEISEDDMYGLGTPEDLEHYLNVKGFPKSKDKPD
jgi:NDP-sugar pyrophosphorylase family protein